MVDTNLNLAFSRRSKHRSATNLHLYLAMLLSMSIGCESETQPNAVAKGDTTIGVATMSADGTIVLTLRAEEEGGTAIGDAQLLYPTDHEEYETILEHIGGIEPGQEKTVAPWDQKQADH